MKKIEALIRHQACEPNGSELLEKGVPSLSISDLKGSGRQIQAHSEEEIAARSGHEE